MNIPRQSSQQYKGRQTFDVTSVCDLIEAFIQFKQPNFFARGEPQEYDDPWMPSIWRTDHEYQDRTALNGGTYTQGELNVLERCQSDWREGSLDDRYFRHYFRDLGADIALDSVDLMHWTGLAQHYNQRQRYPTRLLDVTTNPLVALYFASSSHPDEDGFVVWSPIGNQSNDLSQQPKTEILNTFLEVMEIQASDGGTNYKPNDNTLNFMRPPLPNVRTEAQSGAFIWTRGNGESLLPNGFVLRVLSQHKNEIVSELEALNVTYGSLFPA